MPGCPRGGPLPLEKTEWQESLLTGQGQPFADAERLILSGGVCI